MKFSKFNLIIKEGNKRVLFNTLSGECFKISTGVEEIIDNNLPDQLNKELYDDFLKKGIIVDDRLKKIDILATFKTKQDSIIVYYRQQYC